MSRGTLKEKVGAYWMLGKRTQRCEFALTSARGKAQVINLREKSHRCSTRREEVSRRGSKGGSAGKFPPRGKKELEGETLRVRAKSKTRNASYLLLKIREASSREAHRWKETFRLHGVQKEGGERQGEEGTGCKAIAAFPKKRGTPKEREDAETVKNGGVQSLREKNDPPLAGPYRGRRRWLRRRTGEIRTNQKEEPPRGRGFRRRSRSFP